MQFNIRPKSLLYAQQSGEDRKTVPPCLLATSLPPMPTWNIALGLNAGGEVSVLGDGMAVVVQRGELGRDLGVSGHQHWRKNCAQGRHSRGR